MAQFQKTEQNSMGKHRTNLTCYKDDRGCMAQPPFLLFFFPMYFAFPGLNDGFLCCCDTGTEFQLLDVRTHCVY